MNKTALTELIEWVEEIENSPASLTFSDVEFRTLKQFKEKFKSLLEKEKQQIIDTYRNGEANMYMYIAQGETVEAEDYYNETYGK